MADVIQRPGTLDHRSRRTATSGGTRRRITRRRLRQSRSSKTTGKIRQTPYQMPNHPESVYVLSSSLKPFRIDFPLIDRKRLSRPIHTRPHSVAAFRGRMQVDLGR